MTVITKAHELGLTDLTGNFLYKRIYVRPTTRRALHLQFDISSNTLEIRAVQSSKCLISFSDVHAIQANSIPKTFF
jgi:hypothetical protein